MKLRKCSKCKIEQPIDNFHKYSTIKNGESCVCYTYLCRPCSKEHFKQQREAYRKLQKPNLEHKFCPKCQKTLTIENFRKSQITKDGYEARCKECIRICHKQRIKRIEQAPKPKIDGKICSSCKEYKSYEDYSVCNQNLDGLEYFCRTCAKIKRKKKIPSQLKRERERYYTDPIFRLQFTLRRRTKLAIKTQSKSAQSAKLLGCTGAECMDYLEKLFWPGMTRQNMGRDGWVIDHIIPVAAFDYTDPQWQFKCFHYTNLQPLWNKDNEKKWDRLDWTPAESKYELPERFKHYKQPPQTSLPKES